jgi:hypothetical protein
MCLPSTAVNPSLSRKCGSKSSQHGAFGEGWFRILNPKYSQYEGRRELFEKKLAMRA